MLSFPHSECATILVCQLRPVRGEVVLITDFLHAFHFWNEYDLTLRIATSGTLSSLTSTFFGEGNTRQLSCIALAVLQTINSSNRTKANSSH